MDNFEPFCSVATYCYDTHVTDNLQMDS